MTRLLPPLALALALLPALPPSPALAQGAMYGWSERPYWEVGRLDRELSLLCRQSRFNQQQKQRLKIWFTGRDNIGRGSTGVAKQGWNLIDPTGKAVPNVTYHFVNDGFSNCKVFVAP